MNHLSKKRALTAIFSVIFADIFAFGMVIPLSPILARDFGADGLQIGLLISVYSLIQFFFAPLWGRLSDAIGRRPIMLCGLLGTALAHALFAFSLSFAHLFLARALAGFFGGNLAVAKACIADVTSPERRSKNMALIGLVFGLGFTLGPALGFLFIFAGQALGSSPPYGESFAALGAAIVCCANFAAAFFILRETRPGPPPAGAKKSRDKIPARISAAIFSKQSLLFSRPPLWSVWKSLRAPRLGAALVMSFLLWLSLAQLEPTLILLVQDDFGWGKTGAYGGFAFIGLLIALSQGVLARRLIPKKGERQVNQWGLGFLFSGLFLIGGSAWLPSAGLLSPGFFSLAIGVTLFSIGYSLSDTSLSGMLSLLSGKQEQGKIFGVNQSLSSLARIAGPALGGWLYRDLSHSSPFFAAGAMGAGAFALALWKSRVLPDTGCRAGAAPAPLSQKDTLPPHAINKSQLKSLLEKKIPFCFFALEDLPPSGQPEIDRLAQAAPQKSAEKALALLMEKDPLQPYILLCRNGRVSEQTLRKARRQGRENGYYVYKGLDGLVSSD